MPTSSIGTMDPGQGCDVCRWCTPGRLVRSICVPGRECEGSPPWNHEGKGPAVASAGRTLDRPWRRRNIGRFLFFALFLWVAQVDMRVAIWNPSAYLEYARWAVEPYHHFILGPFAGLIMGTIAVGQLAIAVLVALRGRALTLGLVGAIVFWFWLAIAPLGRGSAFPFSLITSLAAALLWRHRYDRTLIGEVVARIRHRRTAA